VEVGRVRNAWFAAREKLGTLQFQERWYKPREVQPAESWMEKFDLAPMA
jgi:hypothetical protein